MVCLPYDPIQRTTQCPTAGVFKTAQLQLPRGSAVHSPHTHMRPLPLYWTLSGGNKNQNKSISNLVGRFLISYPWILPPRDNFEPYRYPSKYYIQCNIEHACPIYFEYEGLLSISKNRTCAEVGELEFKYVLLQSRLLRNRYNDVMRGNKLDIGEIMNYWVFQSKATCNEY